MASRMSKYSDSSEKKVTRLEKNQEMYKKLHQTELENFDVSSNATILGENDDYIDIEKVKAILDTRYNDVPKRKSIRLEEDPEPYFEEEITKEYDINAILNKAREDKPLDYEEDRSKKLRDTQYDILRKINVSKDDDEKEDELKELINTITLNEQKTKEETNDLFSDLKGSTKTEVFDGIEEDNKTTKLDNTTKMEQTFFSKSTQFNTKDFESLEEEKPKKSKSKEILLVLIMLVFIAGVVIFIKSILG